MKKTVPQLQYCNKLKSSWRKLEHTKSPTKFLNCSPCHIGKYFIITWLSLLRKLNFQQENVFFLLISPHSWEMSKNQSEHIFLRVTFYFIFINYKILPFPFYVGIRLNFQRCLVSTPCLSPPGYILQTDNHKQDRD